MGRGMGERRSAQWASPQAEAMHTPIINNHSSFINSHGFTLIELLVVIAMIALLLAIFIPVMRTARERGQRAVCLSNLRQLTFAWVAYADEHDGRLVDGAAFHEHVSQKRWTLDGWVGRAFLWPESRSALMEDPNKGVLWPYLQDIDAYRCPRGWSGHGVTYTTVVAANNAAVQVEGTYVPGQRNTESTDPGKRVGDTVLKLTRLTDITSPGGSARAVFMDLGRTPMSSEFYVYYLYPKWFRSSAPPIHHADGATLSMADGHAEYWKWGSRETVAGLHRKLMPVSGVFMEVLDGGGTAYPGPRRACSISSGSRGPPGAGSAIRPRIGSLTEIQTGLHDSESSGRLFTWDALVGNW